MTVQSESAQDEAQQYAEQAEELARALYAASPAVTPFSRAPIPFEAARTAGVNSWARAHARAWKTVQGKAEEKDALADLQRRYGNGPTRQGGNA